MTETETYNVTAEELASFIARIEAENEAIAERTADRKEIYEELKGRGYSAPIVREIVKLRKMRPDDRAEREAILDLYKNAIGLA